MKSLIQFKKIQKILTKFENSSECILTFAILSRVSQENLKKFYNFDTKIEYQKYGQRNIFEFSKSLKKIVLVFYSLFDDFEIYKTAQNKYWVSQKNEKQSG